MATLQISESTILLICNLTVADLGVESDDYMMIYLYNHMYRMILLIKS